MKNLAYQHFVNMKHLYVSSICIEFDNDNGICEEINLIIFYDYEKESYSDHPYGEGYAREYHSAQVEIYAVFSEDEFYEYDEDGNLIKTYNAKQNMFEISGFSQYYIDLIENKILDEISDEYYEEDF